MTDERLPWFPCEPGPFLGAMAGLLPDQQLVYVVVMFRIYEDARPCADSIESLARRIGINKRRVVEAIDGLLKAGKLHRVGDALMNRKAEEIIADRKALRETRKVAGGNGARRRWKKTETKQGGDDSKGKPVPLQTHGDIHLDSDIEETTPVGVVAAPRKRQRRMVANVPQSRIDPNWKPADAERVFAVERGFDQRAIELLWQKFVNHHDAKATVSANWSANWRTWVLQEIKFSAERQARAPVGGGRGGSFLDI